MGRLLAVGDIHGCLGKLKTLMAEVRPGRDDTIVFLGDYIDRGPCSAGVIEFLLPLQEQTNTVFLRGNHEAMFLGALAGDPDEESRFIQNGGMETLLSYGDQEIPDSHLHFLNNTRMVHHVEGFLFVHAGLRPGVSIKDQSERDLLWIRDDFIKSDFDWELTVVTGHTPVSEPVVRNTPGRIMLDTGAVFSDRPQYGRLTCCDVRSKQYWFA